MQALLPSFQEAADMAPTQDAGPQPEALCAALIINLIHLLTLQVRTEHAAAAIAVQCSACMRRQACHIQELCSCSFAIIVIPQLAHSSFCSYSFLPTLAS
jgi:hypothetical protein